MLLLKDIQSHPFGKHSPSAQSYAKIAEDLTALLIETPFCESRSVEEVKRMALKLTHYFEDVVSEIGIWESFVTLHRKLYGKPLPFYDVADDYHTDEIHLEDIQFLLWDATLENWEAETMVNPENAALRLAAVMVFGYLQELFEDTPINETLYDFFHEARFTSDFYEVRQVLKWFFFDCYLTSGRFKESVFDEQMDYWTDYCRGNIQVAQQAAEVAVAFNHKIGPLALKPQEWLATLLTVHGQKEKADAVAGIEAKDAEPYILEDFNSKSVTLRNVDDELITVARTKYFKVPNSLLRDSDGCVGCFARYRSEWYLNGMNVWVDSARRMMPKYREETKLESNVDTNTDGLDLNLDKQIYFFQTIEEFDRFRTERLKMPKDQEVRLPKNVKNIIYFIPKTGGNRFCIIPNCAEYIKHPDNPMYDREKAKSYFLIASLDTVPGEFIRYVVAEGLIPDFALNSAKGYLHGRKLTQSNLDFLARTLRRHEY